MVIFKLCNIGLETGSTISTEGQSLVILVTFKKCPSLDLDLLSKNLSNH